MTNNRPIPDCHPRLWDHAVVQPAWTPNEVVGRDGVAAGGCSGDVSMVGTSAVNFDDDHDDEVGHAANAVGENLSASAKTYV